MTEKQETCKRKACDATRIRWWHTLDGGYYCTRCAHRINESAFRAIGEDDILVLHYPCDSCDGLFPEDELSSFSFVPNDKKHLGQSESETIDLCKDCAEH